jgi:hypothetical protein
MNMDWKVTHVIERVLSSITGALWTRAAFVMLVAITGVHQAAPARAAETPALLNDVARVYSLGVGEVRCPSPPEWDADPHRTRFSWGYTNLRSDYTVLPPMICAGAMNVGSASIPAWRQAAGIWMLVHEAFHLRHWRFRGNEAKVGCQTIVYFTDAAARLGASDMQPQELYPYGLALAISNSTSTRGTATRSALCRPGFLLRLPSLSNPL